MRRTHRWQTECILRTAGRRSGAAITLVSERCVTGTAAGGSSANDGTAGASSVAQARRLRRNDASDATMTALSLVVLLDLLLQPAQNEPPVVGGSNTTCTAKGIRHETAHASVRARPARNTDSQEVLHVNFVFSFVDLCMHPHLDLLVIILSMASQTQAATRTPRS